MIVADAGPIIAFARIRRLDLLRSVVGELVIPDAVYEELVQKGPSRRPGATEVEQSSWIQKMAVMDRTALIQLPFHLHLGEREAIILAQEIDTQLLIDESRGRRVAREKGLEVYGSLRILIEAKPQGLIAKVRPVIQNMLDAGYWIDEALIRSLLQETGETRT